MGIDFCNGTEVEFYLQLFKSTKRDLDLRPLYFYLCPVIIFICFFSIIFNAILMSISWQSKVVNKSPILLLSLNLAVTDLIASLLNGLGILLNSYLPEVYDIKMGICSMLVFEVFRYAALVASALHLLALAFVHYRGIVNPLHYRSTIFFSQHLSRTINIISIVCWIIPLTIMTAWFSSSPCQGFQSDKCDYLFLMGFTFRYTVLTLFALPLILMSVIYLRIFIIISRHQKGRRLNHERSTLTRGVMSATGPTCAAATAVNLPEIMESRDDNSNVVVGITTGEGAIARCAYCLARALQDADAIEDDADADADDAENDEQATVAILGNDSKPVSALDSSGSSNGNKGPTTIAKRAIEFDEESQQHLSHRTWRSQHKIDQSRLDTYNSTLPETKRNIITAKGSSVSNWSQSSYSHGSSSGLLQKSNSTAETQTTKGENGNNSSSDSQSESRSDDGSSSNSSSDEDGNDSKSSSSNDEDEAEDGLSGLLVSDIKGSSRRRSDNHVSLRSPGFKTNKQRGFAVTTVDNDNKHIGTFLGSNRDHLIASAINASTTLPPANQYSSPQRQNIIATNKSTTISPFNDCDNDNGKNQQQPQQQCMDKSALLNVVGSNPKIIHHHQQQASSRQSLLSRLNPENLIKKRGKSESRLEGSKAQDCDGGGSSSSGAGCGDDAGESSVSITTDATTATTVRSLRTCAKSTTATTTAAASETTRETRRTVSLLDSKDQQPNDHDDLMERKVSSYKSGGSDGDSFKATRPKTALRAQFSLGPQQQQQVPSKEVRLLTLPASSCDTGTNQKSVARRSNRRAMEQKSLDLQQKRADIQTRTSNPATNAAAGVAVGRFHRQQPKAITVSSDNFPTWECTCDNKLRQLSAKLSRSNTIGDTSGNSQATGSATNRTILSISTSRRSSISSSSVARQSLKSQQFRRSPTIVSGDQQADFRSTSFLGPNAPTTIAAGSNKMTNSITVTTKQNYQPASASSSGTAALTAKQPHQPTTTVNHNNSSFANTNLTVTSSSTYEPQRRHFHSSAVPQTNTKALVTTLLILGTYFISYVPAIIFQVLTCIDNCPYPLHNISFSRRVLYGAMTNLLLIAKSIIDPFIYSYRMSEIQVAINRYLSKRRISKSSHAVSMHYTSQRLNTVGGGIGAGQTNLTNDASHHHHHHHHPHRHHHSSRSQQLNKQHQLNNFNISSATNRTNNSFINMTINDKSSGSGNGCETTKLQVSDATTS